MNLYSAVSSNIRKTWLIMAIFIAFIAMIGYVYGKASGGGAWTYTGFALIFASISSVSSYFWSDKMVIATTGARQIQKHDNPELFNIIENLSIASGLPMPKVYIMDDPSPNAFATGRDPKHGVVCVTTGIMHLLTKSELEGVIAHELSHIKNFDTRLMAITAILVGFIAILADFFMRSLWWGNMRDNDNNDSRLQIVFIVVGIILALLSPIVASLIQLAVSRKREFLADASGALLTRYPEGLAKALEKLAEDKQPLRTASNATAHLFIENPFQEKSAKAWFASLFNTHPPIEERIKILRSM